MIINILLITILIIFFIALYYLYYLHLQIQGDHPVLKKFRKELLKICNKELIYIKIYDDAEELNKETLKETPNIETGKLAVGKYISLPKNYNTTLNKIMNHLPRIELTKNYDTFTLAHELGHHFSIKKNGDRSEETADNYIMELAKKCLEPHELLRISIALKVNSGKSIKINIFKAVWKNLNETILFKFKLNKNENI